MSSTEESIEEFERLGLRIHRRLDRMERPLPLPPELVGPLPHTRPFDTTTDREQWLEVNNAAFSWHPEQGGWSPEDLDRRLAEPWVQESEGLIEDFLVHDDADGRLDGFCWTKVHEPLTGEVDGDEVDGGGRTGEIFVIAVAPRSHGRGLGRQLTVAGLDHLWRRHRTPVGMLYVEADNTVAHTLYERLGFVVVQTDLQVGP